MKFIVNSLKVSFLALCLIAFSTACKKDATDDLPPSITENSNNPGNGMQQLTGGMENSDDELCFDFVFPITVVLPDGTQETGNSLEELETAVDNWYDQNPNSDEDPTLVYPVEAVLEDGTSVSVSSDDELMDLLESCEWDDDLGWEDCLELQYPITINLPDGTTAVANNDEELDQIFEDWLVTNPNSTSFPSFEFPIDVMYDDEIITVNDEDELEALFEACFVDEWDDVDIEFGDCFEFVFPIEVEMPDGSILTANDYEELDEIFITWFEDPDTMGFPTFVYPFTVILDDEMVTIQNEEELDEILEDCYDDGVFEDCFTFNYPITILLPDGSSAEVTNDEELETVIEDWYDQNPNSHDDPTIEYPVDITLDDGSVVTVNSDEELEEIIEECFDCLIVNGGDIATGNQETRASALIIEQHTQIKNNKNRKLARAIGK